MDTGFRANIAVRDAHLRGVVLVTAGDSVVFDLCAGPADERSGTANGHDTRFQLASVSKQFTAAAIVLLADGRALSVHDPVRRWFGRCLRPGNR